jgi:uncharacterized small protein (DUF1192 family)
MNEDGDVDPRQLRPALKDLAPLGIAELNGYIAELEAEIARARLAIQQKTSHRAGIEGLFKR